MTTILLVRRIAEIPSALTTANEFLVHRTSNPHLGRDEMLGLWIRADLDVGLPHCFQIGRASRHAPSKQDLLLAEADVGIRESISLPPVWAHCCLDGPLIRNASNAAERRDVVLRVLSSARSPVGSQQEREVFFPVFRSTQPLEEVATEVRTLETSYPGLIAARWLRRDITGRIAWQDAPKAGSANW